ncbi:MAG TPA: hypothetical protein VF506_00345 [Streptosporangiaceae bacterium]
MPDDRLRELFDRAAAEPVDIVPVERVLARGRQRRSRARLQASTAAWTIMLAAGFGAPQVSGTMATTKQEPPRITSASAGHGDYQQPLASSRFAISHATSAPAPSRSPRPAVSPSPHHTAVGRGTALPPRGKGRLILGLDSAQEYVMTRIGSKKAPVRLTGLKSIAGAPPVLTTNPAGGWVVVFAWGAAREAARDRLALVRASGRSVPFGPLFPGAAVTSAAVSQDGSRVAVAVTKRSGGARIEVLPLPGYRVNRRSWSVPPAQADVVTTLSWSPDGRHVSYLTSQAATAGAAVGRVSLDTAAKVATVPPISRWMAAMRTGLACLPRAAAWLGASGRFAVLSECITTGEAVLQTSDARTGMAVGRPLVVAHKIGCTAASLNSNGSGSEVLISYCGVYLDRHGHLSKQTARLTAAALTG